MSQRDHRRPLVLVFIGSALALTCATGIATEAAITGNVTLSPSCPGPERIDRPCTVPFADVPVELRDAQGAVVARTVTSGDGHFQLNAPAGSYTIRVVTTRPYPRCESPKISIPVDQPAPVQVGCDTGMR
jgi:hypothetical protein